MNGLIFCHDGRVHCYVLASTLPCKYGMTEVKKVPLVEALNVIEKIKKKLCFTRNGKDVRLRTTTMGGCRRKSPYVKDLDLLVLVPESVGKHASAPLLPTAHFRKSKTISMKRIISVGARRLSAMISVDVRGRRKTYHMDLFAATKSEKPFAYFHHTGNAIYNIRVRSHAKKRGWKLNQYGVFYAEKPSVRVRGSERIRSEKDLARFLGVTYHSPQERNEK
jgi:DNA polymerase (family 10)